MPPGGDPTQEKTLQEVVDEMGLYPIEAFVFLQQGLGFAVNRVHGELKAGASVDDGSGNFELGNFESGDFESGDDASGDDDSASTAELTVSRHISGQQLCEGLREYALSQWGMLARVVLARWRINSTFDFGRIVFALIAAGHMQKTDTDTVEDFRNVYDFKTAFDGTYQIGSPR